MAVKRVTVKINSAGVLALLKSGEVAADLAKRADSIHAALPTGGGEEWSVSNFVGRDRAQAVVKTANHQARVSAASDNSLQSALGAGR